MLHGSWPPDRSDCRSLRGHAGATSGGCALRARAAPGCGAAVDARAGTAGGRASRDDDPIRMATTKDVLFAASVEPYTRATIEAAEYAHSQKIPIVAVTDSAVSPLARIARHSVLVSTGGPSFFHSMTPAFVVGEILAAI